jgi:hypothetical protein
MFLSALVGSGSRIRSKNRSDPQPCSICGVLLLSLHRRRVRVAGAVSVCKLKLCLTPNLWLLFGYKTGLFIGWTAVAGRGKM